MDGLSYTVEARDGVFIAVGTWSPSGDQPIYFEAPFTDEAALIEKLLLLQSTYASLRD
jgi:hypothetical protein